MCPQPIMLGDAVLASRMAAALLDRGVYVVGFSYPVVPKGKARIRVQLSAGTVSWGRWLRAGLHLFACRLIVFLAWWMMTGFHPWHASALVVTMPLLQLHAQTYCVACGLKVKCPQHIHIYASLNPFTPSTLTGLLMSHKLCA
jgi:hypothetical protein